jgi:hypothetical protein
VWIVGMKISSRYESLPFAMVEEGKRHGPCGVSIERIPKSRKISVPYEPNWMHMAKQIELSESQMMWSLMLKKAFGSWNQLVISEVIRSI